MLGKRLLGFPNPISKSGPGLEPLCNREAEVGAPDLDLAILLGLQLRRSRWPHLKQNTEARAASKKRFSAALDEPT